MEIYQKYGNALEVIEGETKKAGEHRRIGKSDGR